MQSRAVGFRLLAAVLAACAVWASAPAAQAAPKAAIVMDMRNGQVLHSRQADKRRHPASLTKMMTLYLTFEAVRDGRLRLNQKLRVSRHAARQPASKLYLRAGQRVTVRSLIRATAIKSANDAAMVLAEAIGGSQAGFAKMMNRRAKSLGMANTRFRNPHGLTQSGHYSTARDMAILSRHLFFDYPQYYNIFSRRSDYAAGKRIWNTNRLLRTYRGADGLKTGYTRAAGYNLAATAQRGSRHILAVQMGANSSADRARRVTRLLDMGFARAKRNVRRVPPTGAPRDRILVSRSPLPPPHPGRPATGMAALAQAFSPSAAEAAILPEGKVVSGSAHAPAKAELPVPRGGAASGSRSKGVAGIPLPRPKPVRLAGQRQYSWAAEIGPFGSESAALAVIADMPETANATLSKSPVRQGGHAFTITVPSASRIDAVRACGAHLEAAAECRVVSGAER